MRYENTAEQVAITQGKHMGTIRIDQNLHRIVGEWLESWDFNCYTVDHEELTDAVVEQLRYDYNYEEEVDVDDIDLEVYTKEYEVNNKRA